MIDLSSADSIQCRSISGFVSISVCIAKTFPLVLHNNLIGLSIGKLLNSEWLFKTGSYN